MSQKRIHRRKKPVASVPQLEVFGQPPILEGEDAAAYCAIANEFLKCVEPGDFIELMFLNDLAYLQWDILRMRRFKSIFLEAQDSKQLKKVLRDLIINESPAKAPTNKTPTQAEYPMVEAIMEAMRRIGNAENVAGRLVQEWEEGNSDIAKTVNELVTSQKLIPDKLRGEALEDWIETIERIDRIIALSESRRNMILRELETRRALLAAALRRGIKNVEDGKLSVIESRGPNGREKSAA